MISINRRRSASSRRGTSGPSGAAAGAWVESSIANGEKSTARSVPASRFGPAYLRFGARAASRRCTARSGRFSSPGVVPWFTSMAPFGWKEGL